MGKSRKNQAPLTQLWDLPNPTERRLSFQCSLGRGDSWTRGWKQGRLVYYQKKSSRPFHSMLRRFCQEQPPRTECGGYGLDTSPRGIVSRDLGPRCPPSEKTRTASLCSAPARRPMDTANERAGPSCARGICAPLVQRSRSADLIVKGTGITGIR